MRKLGYNVIHLVELIRFFGFADGIKIWCKIIFTSKKATIEVKSNYFKNPISIRKSDSDIEIFYQVFCELQYDILYHLDFTPKNVIDCGSNVGYSCLYFADKFPQANIVAVEPEINNFRQLEHNTLNYPNIKRYNAAIWHEIKEMSIKDEKEWSASFEVEENVKQGVKVLPGITINEIAEKNNFETIDILKIDIEGAEYSLFANNPHRWLTKTKCLLIELHDQLKPGTSKIFFTEMARYNWRTFIKGENIICLKD